MSTTETLPGVVTKEVSPGVRTMKGVAPLTGFLIGKFPSGDLLSPALMSGSDVGTKLGGLIPGSATHDMAEFLGQGNRMLYVCRVKGTAASISLGADAGTATAKVDGTWANGAGTGAAPTAGIVITASAGSVATTAKIKIQCVFVDGTSTKVYSEEWDNLSDDDESPRYIQSWINANSKLVVISGDPTAIPAAADYLLASGAEPDYDDGIATLGQVGGRLVVFADTDDADVNLALIAAVNARSGTAEDRKAGGSICILNLPQYTSVADMATAGLAITEGRAVLTGAWLKARDSAVNFTRAMRPASFLAGVRCILPYYRSATNKPVNGVVGCERALTEAEMLTLFQAGITSIYVPVFDTTSGRRVISGQSTDGSETFVRIIKDYEVAMGLANLGWVVGENQGEADPDPTRIAIVGQFASTYEAMKAKKIIERYSVQCDAENNPPADIEAKLLTVHREVKYRNVVNNIVDELVAGTESVIAREL